MARTVVVTGGNSGIGLAELLAERQPKVDALINNAGAAPFGQEFTEEGYELQFGANYLAPFLLSHLVLPLLRAAAADTGDARFVHVSSLGHLFGRIDPATFRGRDFYFMVPAYGQSKIGNAMLSYVLARRLPAGLTSNAMHPGIVESRIWREIPKPLFALLKFGIMSTPERAANLNADLAIGDEYRGRTGEFVSAQDPMLVSPIARDERKQDELYALSCELVGIDPL